MIPESVRWLRKNSFAKCENITKLQFRGRADIGEGAFSECTGQLSGSAAEAWRANRRGHERGGERRDVRRVDGVLGGGGRATVGRGEASRCASQPAVIAQASPGR